MKTPLIVGNWKMHMVNREAINLVNVIHSGIREVRSIEIIVCPPFTALAAVAPHIENTNIELGAQNMYQKQEGAFTGEISPLMLKDVGCRYVILGHSERRRLLAERDSFVNKKVRLAIKYNLIPIACIGETLEERESHQTMEVIERQFHGSFKGLSEADWKRTVIAYEPIWAIGTGKTATPEQAEEVQAHIRGLLEKAAPHVAGEIRILYGGSIKPDNITELMAKPNIDGGLVGGASLKGESFIQIIKGALSKKEESALRK